MFNKERTELIAAPGVNGVWTIPAGVSNICENAFYGSVNLKGITASGVIASIGDRAFRECYNLQSVNFSKGINAISGSAFLSCTNLTVVSLGEGLTSLSLSTFSDCKNLSSFSIPKSLKALSGSIKNFEQFFFTADDGAYYTNADKEILIRVPTSIEGSFTIPESVRFVMNYAFSGCSKLNEIIIPDTLETVDYLGDFNFYFDDDGVAYESNEKKVLIRVPMSLAGEFTVPESVRIIHSDAFSCCSELTSITLHDNITYIGDNAFSACAGIFSITLPANLKHLGSFAFSECRNLTSIRIPGGVKSIYCGTFRDCENMYSAEIDEGVTVIESGAFEFCRMLGYINIPKSLTYFGHQNFCSEWLFNVSLDGIYESWEQQVLLEVPWEIEGSFVIPETVRFIGSGAVGWCEGLTSLVIPEGVELIGSSAINAPNLTSITIPESLTHIDYAGFSINTIMHISASYIPEGISRDNITTVYIPEAASSVRHCGFMNCPKLESVVIPTNIVSIKDGAFAFCERLSSVKFMGMPPEVERSSFSCVAEGCKGFYPVEYAEQWEEVIPDDGVWNGLIMKPFSLTEALLDESPVYLFDYVVSNSEVRIRRIVDYSYDGAIKIPETIAGFPVISFDGYNNSIKVRNLELSSSLRNIGHYAARNAAWLESLKFQNGVINIGKAAFYGCFNLKEIVIPGSLKKISEDLFGYCASLKSVTLENGIELIEDRAFYKCRSLEEIAIPNSITKIGHSAFAGCSMLRTAVIGNGVATIENYAFKDCIEMESLTFGEDVSKIGNFAFSNCSNITEVIFRGPPPTVLLADFPATSGYYSNAYRDEWLEVIDSDCRWNNLQMSEFEEEVEPEESLGEFEFLYETHKGRVTITGYTGTLPSDLVIPAKINRKRVEAIADEVFANSTTITSLVISEGVKSIGNRTFYNCTDLTDVRLPRSLNRIGREAFAGTAWYQNLWDNFLDGFVFFDKWIFGHKGEWPSNVNVPDDMIGFEDGAFDDSAGVETVSLPKHLRHYSSSIQAGGSSARAKMRSVRSSIQIYIRDEEGLETPSGVPHEWFTTYHSDVLEAADGNYETAAATIAANGMTFEECYLAGLNPDKPDSKINLTIEIDESGKPVLSWNDTFPDGTECQLLQKVNDDWVEILEENLGENLPGLKATDARLYKLRIQAK